MEILKIDELTQLVFGILNAEFGAFKSSGNLLLARLMTSISFASVATFRMICLDVQIVVLGYGKG